MKGQRRTELISTVRRKGGKTPARLPLRIVPLVERHRAGTRRKARCAHSSASVL